MLLAVQEEGYQAALECSGMTLLQTQLKVEPCISAGPKAKKKSARSGTANGTQHNDSAPKASPAVADPAISWCAKLPA